jgi:hypothetical protein
LKKRESIWSEKRMSPRVSVTGNMIFKAYWASEYNSDEFHGNRSVPADLLDMSMDGMRIKTFFPLEENNMLEFSGDYQVIQIALVRWVKKMEDCYHAGLLYIHH